MLDFDAAQISKTIDILKKMGMLSEAQEEAIKEATYITGEYDERGFVQIIIYDTISPIDIFNYSFEDPQSFKNFLEIIKN